MTSRFTAGHSTPLTQADRLPTATTAALPDVQNSLQIERLDLRYAVAPFENSITEDPGLLASYTLTFGAAGPSHRQFRMATTQDLESRSNALENMAWIRCTTRS